MNKVSPPFRIIERGLKTPTIGEINKGLRRCVERYPIFCEKDSHGRKYENNIFGIVSQIKKMEPVPWRCILSLLDKTIPESITALKVCKGLYPPHKEARGIIVSGLEDHRIFVQTYASNTILDLYEYMLFSSENNLTSRILERIKEHKTKAQEGPKNRRFDFELRARIDGLREEFDLKEAAFGVIKNLAIKRLSERKNAPLSTSFSNF